ncbi:MAG TPA: CPBP family intramembrane glutamic endopeptidase [Thermoanaerobaculia bacterium]|nr:CPBP family intramembrane glutamic endopeptidase [Thermoanaerobaculia bacterium]
MPSLTGPLAAALGLAAAFALDRLCAARGLLPPGFREPWRRVVAGLVVAGFLGAAVFLPLAAAVTGAVVEPPNLSKIDNFQLFELHVIMIAVMAFWLLLGFAGLPEPERAAAAVPVPPAPQTPEWEGLPVDVGLPPPEAPPPLPPSPPPPSPPPAAVPLGRQLLAQLGFLAPDVPREIGIGLTLGLGAWLAVLAALIAIAGVLIAVGAKDLVPQQPPALVPLIAALPFGIRLAVSLSAGIVEETFFRGFLQPRIGIVLSTAFFALAHLSYQQPFMLVGITLLSLIYAFLVRWRQSIWAAIAAHALFDGVQLLVVVPMVLKLIHGTGAGAAGKTAAAVLGLLG